MMTESFYLKKSLWIDFPVDDLVLITIRKVFEVDLKVESGGRTQAPLVDFNCTPKFLHGTHTLC
jgi:hypothetical protein